MWFLKQINFATDLWPEVYWWDELSNACYCWHKHEGGMWGNICNNGTINLLKKYIWYTYWHSCTVLVHDWLYGTVKQLAHLLFYHYQMDIKRQHQAEWLFKLPGVGRSVGGRKVATAPRASGFFLTLELDNRAKQSEPSSEYFKPRKTPVC